MGQKVNPHGLRVGVIADWESKWYADKKNFADNLVEDHKIREYIKKKLFNAGIAELVIERTTDTVKVTILTAKAGVVIGNKGSEIEKLKKEVQKLTSKKVELEIKEVKRPDGNAQLSAENIAAQLENRVAFRKAMKKAVTSAMKTGAKGVKVKLGGRLGGAEIARKESISEGTIPLQTIRANIDYGFAEAHTTYGKIGVKVWIYKGEVLPARKQQNKKEGGDK
ncbi:MAG: 30S ribosomal protein S3 [Lachnospiraceae bacterium]|nr:30S ribosomal protein S3 [Lachnospiraceae bacterium]